MDSILLSANRKVLDGLNRIAQDMLDDEACLCPSAYVEPSDALFIIEMAKRAEDREDYFPHGKWATIQAIQERVDKELDKLKKGTP